MIVTSLDGQWAIVRRARAIALLERGEAPAVSTIDLPDDDVDLAFVGPPAALLAIVRGPEPRVVLHHPPTLEAVARIDLERPMRLAAVTGARAVLIGDGGKAVTIIRVAGRGMSSHPIEVTSPVEFSVGLERNQVLFSIAKKLEVWDALSTRPLLRLQLQLPPAPRTVGAAQGHLWCTRPGSDEVYVYRLSDGRPFRHYAGATVQDVVSHPASPVIVLVTPAGLVRMHCFAHSLTAIEAPSWIAGAALGQLATADALELIGLADGATEPWRVALGGGGTATITPELDEASGTLRAPVPEQRDRRTYTDRNAPPEEPSSPSPVQPAPTPLVSKVVGASAGLGGLGAGGLGAGGPGSGGLGFSPGSSHASGGNSGPTGPATTWRDALVAYGLEVTRGHDGDLPTVPVDSTIGELAHRLTLPSPARRALLALYGLYLQGEPAPSIARLAHALGDWREALGTGELAALAMLTRRDGRVRLRRTVTDLLDGVAPRAIRLVGSGRAVLRSGAAHLLRADRPAVELEETLRERFGRIAIVIGPPRRALLEARLHGAIAILHSPPDHRPAPWPRDLGLLVVTDGVVPAWVAALPADAG